MNEVFETVAEVLEELRSEAGEREYSVCTKEAKNTAKELKRANYEYEKLLADFRRTEGAFGKIYGYCGSCSFSRRTKSVLSGNDRCDTDI